MKIRKNRKSTLALLAAGALAASVAVSACTGVKDPDLTVLTHCQLAWANQGETTGRHDVYVLEMPVSEWEESGEKAFGQVPGGEVSAVFFDEMLVNSASQPYLARAITTAGTFNITTGAEDPLGTGMPVTMTDDGDQLYWDYPDSGISGALVGSGGKANFNGPWSDPTSSQTTPAPGSYIQMVYMGDPITLGDFTQFGKCYNINTFAPMSVADRVQSILLDQAVFGVGQE